MKEVLETIIRSLISEQDSFSINVIEDEKQITYEVRLAEKDMGKVIGREGRVAKAIRTVAKAVNNKGSKRVNIEFIG